MKQIDEMYMRRALQLARNGYGRVSPNPMVGAVIVADGRIIGEGYHRQYGGPHAEVNAVNSVAPSDSHLLEKATIYVTLEPCAHYGKTPPCARLIVDKKIPRVVVGAMDPFALVAGKGVEIIRSSGAEVITGVLSEECEQLNKRFMTAHRLGRPFVELKWARTADGYIGARDACGHGCPLPLSNSLSRVWMHRDRAGADAVMVGTDTALCDNPSLTLRLWPGRNPERVTFDNRHRLPESLNLFNGEAETVVFNGHESLREVLAILYNEHKVTSLIVEGGACLLQSFLREGLWDELRVETCPCEVGEGVKGPEIPAEAVLEQQTMVRDNVIRRYKKVKTVKK